MSLYLIDYSNSSTFTLKNFKSDFFFTRRGGFLCLKPPLRNRRKHCLKYNSCSLFERFLVNHFRKRWSREICCILLPRLFQLTSIWTEIYSVAEFQVYLDKQKWIAFRSLYFAVLMYIWYLTDELNSFATQSIIYDGNNLEFALL